MDKDIGNDKSVSLTIKPALIYLSISSNPAFFAAAVHKTYNHDAGIPGALTHV
jgi:hypothetical protein